MINALKARRILRQATAIPSHSTAVYAGFDPTAASLHVGHLPIINALALAATQGYLPIALVGGATGRIGDPTGRSVERPLLQQDILQQNTEAIGDQLSNVYNAIRNRYDFDVPDLKVIDNWQFYKDLKVLDFLAQVGGLRVNSLLSKDSVTNRGEGLSYGEFSYQLLQAFDFLHLAQNYSCYIQIGGSDQWGNITTGTELVRRQTGKEAGGVTLELITSGGEKIGKSAGNAVFLTDTPYNLYQYCYNLPDDGIDTLLLSLTQMSEREVQQTTQTNDTRAGQISLGKELVSILYNPETADRIERSSAILFSEDYHKFSKDEIADNSTIDAVRVTYVKQDNHQLSHMLKTATLVSGTKEARRLISSGGIRLNGEAVKEDIPVEDITLLHDRFVFVKIGKRKIAIVTM